MRVAVDATSWANRRGYGRFARNVVTSLVERDRDSAYVLVCDTTTAERDDLPQRAEALVVPVRPETPGAAARPLGDIVRLSRATRRLRPDAVLFPSVYTWFPVLRTPTVVGVHDVIADERPELTLPSRAARLKWTLKRRAAARQATRIFTVSEASRAVVGRALGLEPSKLAVVPEAPDPVFGPRPAGEIAAELGPIGLEPGERYLLYVGGISPHKGLETLLDAFAEVARRPDAPRLVIAGALEDEAYVSAATMVRERVAASALAGRVLLPGHVPDATLACLYAGALAFVSPSTSEGFGLPAVEAAVSRTAVVLSDIPAHRETLGDAARFFPVGDAVRLAAVLAEILSEPGLRDRLASAAAGRAAGWTWGAAADALRTVLVEVAGGG